MPSTMRLPLRFARPFQMNGLDFFVNSATRRLSRIVVPREAWNTSTVSGSALRLVKATRRLRPLPLADTVLMPSSRLHETGARRAEAGDTFDVAAGPKKACGVLRVLAATGG